jgi:hypothetical protein
LIVKHPRGETGTDFAGFVRAAHRLWYGDGKFLKRLEKVMTAPTYEDARRRARKSERFLRDARVERNWQDKDDLYRPMFDALFHAARYAAMAYLHTDLSRWGVVKDSLPPQFRTRFKRIVDKLHITYAYDGHYPPDRVEEEYGRWRETVLKFIDDLEVRSRKAMTADSKEEKE